MKRPHIHPSHALFLLAVAVPLLLAAQETGAAAPADDSLSLWGMIRQGGWAMFPLGACSLVMLFLTFYSWRETSPAKFHHPDQIQRARELLGSQDLAATRETLTRHANVLARTLAPVLNTMGRGKTQPQARETAENAFADRLEAEENSVGQWVTYLNVVAAVAPMIGLLGTVSGMISAFQTIGRGGMGKPELLAGDIGEALVTTATGLVIGIPAMIAYFVMRNRLNGSLIATTRAGSELIELACRPGGGDRDANPETIETSA
jgi:biopolymer transport protein ExbB